MARFYRRGKSKIYALPIMAGVFPTDAEIDAGTDLTEKGNPCSVADVSGFQLTNTPIDTPDWSDNYTSQIEGEDTTDASTLTFYDDEDDDEIRTLLAKGSEQVIVFFPYGRSVAGKRGEAWRTKSTGVNDVQSSGAEAAKFIVGFAVQARPNQDGVIPAITP